MNEVAVVIPAWNTRELLSSCLFALEKSSVPLEIVVVDNHSSDGSAEMVEREHPRARLLRNPENRGFAAASNQGIAATTAPFVLLLNSDTEVAPDAVARLLRFLEQNPSYAAAAPRLLNPDGSTQRACMNFPSLGTALWFGTPLERWFPHSAELERYFARSFDHEHDSDVDQPPAAALLLRRAALERVGLLDESMFLYFNDVDLSKRLAAAGWCSRFLRDARVVHVGGASTRQFGLRLERWHLDRLRYYRKHHGWFAGPWVKAATSLAWIDFAVRSLWRRFVPGSAAPSDPIGPVTRAFLRFLAA
ncbi:MAG TPA: glycosyltransferase family 2 protein [Planctomycetota bacterium]|nr:glycosyltransferase family 2 protein [Planctomycetota bacterium]